MENEDKDPWIEEFMDKVETYPAVPRPVTVDVIFVMVRPPGPKAVEKVDKAPVIDEYKDNVETYPRVPSPVSEEYKLCAPSNTSPFTEETNNCCELSVIALAVPATSKAVPGVAV